MGATLYPVDDSAERRRENAIEVFARIEDLRHVLDNTKTAKGIELARIADQIDQWSILVKKEKAMYHTMNSFNYDINRKALIAEGWCPTISITTVQYALRNVTVSSLYLTYGLLYRNVLDLQFHHF